MNTRKLESQTQKTWQTRKKSLQSPDEIVLDEVKTASSEAASHGKDLTVLDFTAPWKATNQKSRVVPYMHQCHDPKKLHKE